MRLFDYKEVLHTIIVGILLVCTSNSAFAETPCLCKRNRYIVSEIVDLKGEELQLKDKTILVIKGRGKFVNGRISGRQIIIEAANHSVFASSVTTRFEETSLKSEWYENLLNCIIGNSNCTISIKEGDYAIDNPVYAKITSSLYGRGIVTIRHSSPFSVGDNVTIYGLNWDGQNKTDYWMYCQPNNLTIKNCSFKNYFGECAGIIYWSHSEIDTKDLLIENCIFGKVGADGNGVIGDMNGSSTVIYTYRCINVTIRNNTFREQYGDEDSDAIKLEGVRIYTPNNFPLPSGEEYRYGEINAIVEENEFVNVPKSPVKIFASGVVVRNNKMTYRGEVKTAIARAFRGESILVEGNVANAADAVLNAIEVHSCRNVRLNKNSVTSTCDEGKTFGELLRIEKSDSVNVANMIITMFSSSMSNTNQALVRLSGKDITIKNSFFQAPYSYYGIYAPLGIDGLLIEKTKIEVEKGIQYAFLVNNAVKEPHGTCKFNKCTFRLASEKIDGATSYGAIFANNIEITDCNFIYDKGITLKANMIEVRGSLAYGFNLQGSSSIALDNIQLSGRYTPIVVGTIKEGARLMIKNVRTEAVELSFIRFQNNIPQDLIVHDIDIPGLNEFKLIRIDNLAEEKIFYARFNKIELLKSAMK